MEPARVLVVGGGLIGCHASARLAGVGHPTILVSRSAPPVPPEGVAVELGDAGDPDVIRPLVERSDLVLYAAGDLLPSAPGRDAAVDIAMELRPLVSVLSAMRDGGASTIAYISSGGTVYGQPQRLPIDEDHPTEPISTYGTAKLAGEKLVSSFGKSYGIRTRILRCANVYGEGQRRHRGHGAVAVFMHRLRQGQPLIVYGDGSVIRDFVHVGDVATAIHGLLVHDAPTLTVNVGSGSPTPIRELVDTLGAVTGLRVSIEWRPPRRFDVEANVLDVTRLGGLLDWDPLPLDQGLRRTWASIPVRG